MRIEVTYVAISRTCEVFDIVVEEFSLFDGNVLSHPFGDLDFLVGRFVLNDITGRDVVLKKKLKHMLFELCGCD